MIKGASRQTGLGLVSAIFVITVLALLAAGMAALVANSAKIHSQNILSVRAHNAAQSGLEITLSSMIANSRCEKTETEYQYDTQGLYQCSASITCQQVTHRTQDYFSVTSQGSCGSGIDTATKRIEKRWIK
jgi:MSHA biogenesis protein MshP